MMEGFDFEIAVATDFDGVLADNEKARILFAKKEFGVTLIPPVKREIVVERDHKLTNKQYRTLQQETGGKWEWAKLMEPIPGALSIIAKLYRAKCVLFVVTSRTDEVMSGKTESRYPLLSIANKWLKQKGILHYFREVKGAGYQKSKELVIKHLYPRPVVYLDDDVDKLVPLEGIVEFLFLLSMLHNLEQELPFFIQRVDSWEDFYERICEIGASRVMVAVL
ncbi:MAG: hypothetical protein PHW31_01505 [Candidatus Pacebacteria bacterium]|nr:hypothetical protein [Candidatus Paceibacterota bacterium]